MFVDPLGTLNAMKASAAAPAPKREISKPANSARSGASEGQNCETTVAARGGGDSQSPEALRIERDLLTAVLDMVAVLVVVLDAEGRILRLNRAAELAIGRSVEEVEGKPLWSVFRGAEEGGLYRTIFQQVLRGGLGKDLEACCLTRDGRQRLIAWTAAVVPGSGQAPGYVVVTGSDITESHQLGKAILETIAREQRRIGQDLHDGLGQHLTGIAFMSKVLERKLLRRGVPEAAEARKIVRLVNEAVEKTRDLARGLLPVMSDAQGLSSALKHWVIEVEDMFAVSCEFRCPEPVLIGDPSTATHLFHIAQEAVNNAIRHGQAKRIIISLSAANGTGTLCIQDYGRGIEEKSKNPSGQGLRIMNYRAKMIAGSVAIDRSAEGGTCVTCRFPV